MKDRQDSITPMYSSNRVYNTHLLSSIYLYRVSVKNPPGKGITDSSYSGTPPYSWQIESQIKDIFIEAPTVLIAIMTARDLGYDVTHVQCMDHD